jgi:hypothetical protein
VGGRDIATDAATNFSDEVSERKILECVSFIDVTLLLRSL